MNSDIPTIVIVFRCSKYDFRGTIIPSDKYNTCGYIYIVMIIIYVLIRVCEMHCCIHSNNLGHA